ncbi:hypothetical protein F4212_02630 [Candidatus Poribacteria bacterium]|nr:hypothetical protein [Gammaproteobacteria bacterium]MYF98021.1 hypothetical protein [Candidatus Poribacteria bacterium]
MNKKQLADALKRHDVGGEIDVSKVPEWFKSTLATLHAQGKQKDGMGHSGKRGSLREDVLASLVAPLLPDSLSLERSAFAVNSVMASSKEQDLLIVDKALFGKVLPPDDYFAIESCLGAVQVKSTLSRSTIRDAIDNCASIKRLFYPIAADEDAKNRHSHQMCYMVFAFSSDLDLDRLKSILNEEAAEIPRRDFWPNAFHVLGKGMLIPGNPDGVPLNRDTMFTGNVYQAVDKIGAEPAIPDTEAYPFLWFLANLVDHCIDQRTKRSPPSYMNYWFHAWSVQMTVLQSLEREDRKDSGLENPQE